MEILTYCGSVIVQICKYAWVKLGIAAAFTTLSFFIGELNHDAILGVYVLLIFDFITGIEAALKTGQPVESKKVLRTAVKMTMYFLLISAGYMAEKAVPLISFIDDTIISFLAVTELISILENTSRSGYAIPVKLVEKLKAFKQNT